jgi:hypothetical protein
MTDDRAELLAPALAPGTPLYFHSRRRSLLSVPPVVSAIRRSFLLSCASLSFARVQDYSWTSLTLLL